MINIAIEVSNGGEHLSVAVYAHSIQQAVELVARRYPNNNLRVLFPLNPETFFVRDTAAVEVGLVELAHNRA